MFPGRPRSGTDAPRTGPSSTFLSATVKERAKRETWKSGPEPGSAPGAPFSAVRRGAVRLFSGRGLAAQLPPSGRNYPGPGRARPADGSGPAQPRAPGPGGREDDSPSPGPCAPISSRGERAQGTDPSIWSRLPGGGEKLCKESCGVRLLPQKRRRGALLSL